MQHGKYLVNQTQTRESSRYSDTDSDIQSRIIGFQEEEKEKKKRQNSTSAVVNTLSREYFYIENIDTCSQIKKRYRLRINFHFNTEIIGKSRNK